MKSTVQQIRERFDKDVERFSRLEIGNTAQVDSVLSLELIACAAAVMNPNARSVLDVGCGAGNYVVKILEQLPNLNVTLLDLSQPMLQRALQRVTQATRGAVQAIQGDIREAQLGIAQFDVVVAAAVCRPRELVVAKKDIAAADRSLEACTNRQSTYGHACPAS